MDGRGWVDAGGLLAGDRLVSTDTDTRLEVIDATREPHPAGITVYNFEVQGDHTYFVADADTSFTNPVWVHNATGGNCGGWSLNQGAKRIAKGNKPSTVIRADKGRGTYEKDHIHFLDGSALNNDGTWKHGGKTLTNAERDFLNEIGWTLPGA